MRLQRYLAQCGLGSRRACEDLISEGIVTVDGQPVSTQGQVIDPDKQSVCVRGKPVRPQPKIYLALNKPRRVLCTSNDPRDRPTFLDFLPGFNSRVYSIGRLDWDSEGLLLVTNDGDFAHLLLHPRHHVARTYRVWVKGTLSDDDQARILEGVQVDGECLKALDVRVLHRGSKKSRYRVVLGEGRNRHIRRMFAALGFEVVRLQRVAVGSFIMGALRPGQFRRLTGKEVEALREEAGQGEDPGTQRAASSPA